MAFGDTATVLLTEKKLKIKWNTGVVVDDSPVYYNQTISVENDITPQEAYDIAFKLDTLTSYTVAGIEFETSDDLGPIS